MTTQTLQGALQQAVRTAFSTANDFNGDLHAMCDWYGVPAAPISGRLIPAAKLFDPSITDAASALNYFLQNYASTVPTLALDFTSSSSLDSRITFTRASTATFFNSAGVLTSAANNVARFDYNPSTLAARGLLIEEARTNSIRNNTMQGAVAGTPGTSPTNWTLSLAGGLSREIVGVGTANGINYIDIRIFGTTTNTNLALNVRFEPTTQIAASTGQTWTESVWVQMVGGTTSGISYTYLTVVEQNGAGADLAYLSGSSFLSTISTFTRRTSTVTTANASTAFVCPSLWVGSTGIGAAIDITLRIGLPQLELGAFATSVIPTTTTALTRNADVASMTGTNFSSWFNAVEGTVVCIGTSNASSSDGTNLSISDGTNGNRIQFGTGASNTVWNPFVVTSASTVATLTQSVSFSPKTNPKLALAYKANDFAATTAGASVVTDASGNVPVVDRLLIGASGSGTVTWNSYIQRISYYPSRLPNGTLQALTA